MECAGHAGALPALLPLEEAVRRVAVSAGDRKRHGIPTRACPSIRHIGGDRFAKAFANENVFATADFDRLGECDAIIICVPTPLGAHREPDLKYIRITAEQIALRLRPGQLVVLESTTYPGTTREELLPRFEGPGLVCGR